MTLRECIDHFGIDAILEDIGMNDCIEYFGEGYILNEIGMETAKDHFDLIEDYSAEDAYNRYGHDLLDHFDTHDLQNQCVDWEYIVNYVSNNFGSSDILEAYGDNQYLFSVLLDELREDDPSYLEQVVQRELGYKIKPRTIDLLSATIKAHRESFT